LQPHLLFLFLSSEYIIADDDGVQMLVTELTSRLTTFLNSPLAIELYARLLMKFAKVSDVEVSTQLAEEKVDQLLKDFEYSIDSYPGAQNGMNYMESIPADNEIFVAFEWLSKVAKIKQEDPTSERYMIHRHLLFQKALHEVAHLMTPKFHDICCEQSTNQKRKKKDHDKLTPEKLDSNHKKGKLSRGECGFALEEILSGGRLYHFGHIKSLWDVYRLYLQKETSSGRTNIFQVSESFPGKRTFEKLDDFKLPTEKIDFTEFPKSVMKSSPLVRDDHQSDYDPCDRFHSRVGLSEGRKT
jgi:hypothetical protein